MAPYVLPPAFTCPRHSCFHSYLKAPARDTHRRLSLTTKCGTYWCSTRLRPALRCRLLPYTLVRLAATASEPSDPPVQPPADNARVVELIKSSHLLRCECSVIKEENNHITSMEMTPPTLNPLATHTEPQQVYVALIPGMPADPASNLTIVSGFSAHEDAEVHRLSRLVLHLAVINCFVTVTMRLVGLIIALVYAVYSQVALPRPSI